jgi:hypothetical protein
MENRQDRIKELDSNSVLVLKRELDNEYDCFAIAVYNNDFKIGYIPKGLAEGLSNNIDTGQVYDCFVSKITGGGLYYYGLNIQLNMSNKRQGKNTGVKNMNKTKQNNYRLLKECFKIENGFNHFKQGLLQSQEYFIYIDEVINYLCIPVRYAVDKNVLVDEIIRWAYHGCIAINNSDTEDEYFSEIRENMEIAFGDYRVTGVIMATIGTWSACIFLGVDLNLNKLENCSFDAAFTEVNQRVIEDNWVRVGSKMEQYLNKSAYQ